MRLLPEDGRCDGSAATEVAALHVYICNVYGRVMPNYLTNVDATYRILRNNFIRLCTTYHGHMSSTSSASSPPARVRSLPPMAVGLPCSSARGPYWASAA